eukprot:TCONS_00045404-protein
MFHFEFKLTSDTLLSPASSSILIVDANEGSLFYVIVKDPLTLDFSGVGSFQPQKNVYHKVVITQFFSPFQNRCLKQYRIDGKRISNTFFTMTYTNVSAYTTATTGMGAASNVMIKNFYLLDLDKDV